MSQYPNFQILKPAIIKQYNFTDFKLTFFDLCLLRIFPTIEHKYERKIFQKKIFFSVFFLHSWKSLTAVLRINCMNPDCCEEK